MNLKILLISLLILLIPLILILEVIAALIGKRESFENPSRNFKEFGEGKKITYLILGDSITAGQGGDYEKGIAVQTAKHMADKYNLKVSMINFSVSGARIKGIINDQLRVSVNIIPDIVLVSVGANDVTGLTSLSDFENDLHALINNLQKRNPRVKIILTGSPDVGITPRLLFPLNKLASLRVWQINNIFKKIAKENVFLAPIVEEVSPPFKENKKLFYEDNYHPNTEGYQVWIQVLNNTIDNCVPRVK